MGRVILRKITARVPLLIALATAGLLLASCGTQQSADLFQVDRSGSIPGAKLKLIVSDSGTATCNGGTPKALPGDQLLAARDLAARLAEDKDKPRTLIGFSHSVYNFKVTFGAGKIEWKDGDPNVPASFKELVYLTRKIAKGTCGLSR